MCSTLAAMADRDIDGYPEPGPLTPPSSRPEGRAGLRGAANAPAMGVPVLAAASRTIAGRALAAAGRTEVDIRELDDAAKTLHVCGAVQLRDAAEQALRSCGRPVYRRSSPTW
jgi:hypothetical protein